MRSSLATRLALTALVLVAFGQAIGFPFLHWDDPSHLVDNPLVVAPFREGLGALFATPTFGYPAPATVLGWSLEHAIFGMRPTVFHATNVILHLVNLWLLHRLVIRLGGTENAAAITCAIFALHPVVTEPVVWVTGRKDLQATALVLGAVLVLLGPRATQPSLSRLAFASSLAVLAMLSKPTAAIAPLWMALAARHEWPEDARRITVRLVPLVLIAAALVIVGNRGHQALAVSAARSGPEALHQVLGAWALQTRHLLAPVGLLPAYYERPGDPSSVALALGLGIGALVLFAIWRTKTRLVAMALVWFLLAYAPVAAILPNRRWVADSYLYLPLLGLAIAAGVAVDQRWSSRVTWIVVALALTIGSVLHAPVYASSASLWEPVVERYPDHAPVYALYGMGLSYDRREDEAAKVFVHIAKEWPDHPGLEANQAWAFLRLGLPARAKERLERGAARGDAECERLLRGLGASAEPR